MQVLLAEDDTIPVGFIAGKLGMHADELQIEAWRPHGYISDLFVAPAYRGTGAAQMLLTAMIDRLRADGRAPRADRGAVRQSDRDQDLPALRVRAVLDGAGPGAARDPGLVRRLVAHMAAAASAVHVAPPAMLADGKAAIDAPGDQAGLGESNRVAAPSGAADLSRLGLPDRVMMMLPPDQRVRDLVQDRVVDLGVGRRLGKPDGDRNGPAAEMAGAATALGVIECEPPASKPVLVQETGRPAPRHLRACYWRSMDLGVPEQSERNAKAAAIVRLDDRGKPRRARDRAGSVDAAMMERDSVTGPTDVRLI